MGSVTPTSTSQGEVEVLISQYQAWITKTGIFLGTMFAVYVVGRLLLVPPFVEAARRRNPNNPTLVDALRQYLQVAVVVIGVPLATAAAGFGDVVAGSAVVVAAVTLALGVAGQDVIGNLVSGIFLVADPEFNVDDFIAWGDQMGTVERINLRATKVRSIAGEVVTVPNTDLATSSIRHPFARDRYRLTLSLAVGYEDDFDRVSEVICDVVTDDDRVLDDPGPSVYVTGLGDDGVELDVYLWVDSPPSTNLDAVRTTVATTVKDRLLAEGFSVAPASQREISGSVEVRGGDDPGSRPDDRPGPGPEGRPESGPE